MKNKSLNALRTIGEVSKQIKVGSHTLRSWEKMFPEAGASKRIGGRRYYTREDYETLLFIQAKLKEGYAARGIKELLLARKQPEETSFSDAAELAIDKQEIFSLRKSIEELRKRLILI